MYVLYHILQVLLLPVLVPWYLWKAATTPKYRAGLRERFTVYDGELRKRLAHLDRPVWIQTVSVGEFLATKVFIEALREAYPEVPLVVTSTTETGQNLAKKELPSEIPVFYFPLDLLPLVRRTFALVRPRALVLAETELWPDVIGEAARLRIPVVQVNGRLSDTSVRRFQKLAPLARPMLARVTRWGMQSPEDAERIASLGIPRERITVLGNFKFDSAIEAIDRPHPKWETLAADLAPWRGQPTLVIGSTHPGEDGPLLEVVRGLREQVSGLRTILAPRHVERVPEIIPLVDEAGLRWWRRSELSEGTDLASTDVLLLDTIGELAGAYALADLAVIGGSFIRHGGQNVIEPVASGKLTFCGPSMENFRAAVALLVDAGALIQVADTEELSAALGDWFARLDEANARGQAGRDALRQQAGAVQRGLEFLRPFMRR